MKRFYLIILIIFLTISGIFISGCSEEDDDDDEECTEYWGDCVHIPYVQGTLTINVTINDENPEITVYIYEGDYENDILIDTVSLTETSYSRTLDIGSYSATADYVYGEFTITSVDGDSISNSSGEYCEGTCYELENGELDLSFDEDAFNEMRNDENDKCFIATASYGSIDADEVKILRNFRDEYLLKSSFGSWCVEKYYSLSPPIADYIRHKSSLKFIIRCLLTPVVFIIKYPFTLLLMLLFFFIFILRRFRKAEKTAN